MSKRILAVVVVLAVALVVMTGAVVALLVSDNDKTSSPRNPATTSAGTGKGYLGVTVTAQPLVGGLRVASVEDKGPAAIAGIQVGDTIRSVDGAIVRTPEQLRNATESKAPGADVKITFERGDRELQAQAKLAEAPADAKIEATPPSQNRPPQAQTNGRQIGIQVAAINPQLKNQYGLTRDNGIVIVQVQANTAAATAGLKQGDVILQVGERVANTPNDVQQAIQTAPAGQSIALKILRGSDEMTVTVAPQMASIPGLENLPPEIQQRLAQLMQNGTLPADQLAQLQRLLTGAQGYTRVGKVKEASAASITITPLEGGSDTTIAINDKTQVRRGGQQISATAIPTGATVMVLSGDGGQTAAAIVAFP